jgi:PEP-CTERM motif
MTQYGLGLLVAASIAAIVGSQSAYAAATELSPGPAIVSGPITNGSTVNLQSTGTTVTEIFVGVDAHDTDILNLGATPIFNNQSALPGAAASQTVASGSVLNFNLDNTNDFLGAATYATGTAYTNDFDNVTPVYHFAFFDVTGAADVNSLFGRDYVPVGSAFDTFFQSNGGYSSWVFVGVEDSPITESDDWNDTIYAFKGVAPVGTEMGGGGAPGTPEPSTWVMMIMGFAGLGFAGHRASRKSAVAA